MARGRKTATVSGRKMPPPRSAIERYDQKSTCEPSLSTAMTAATTMVASTRPRVSQSSVALFVTCSTLQKISRESIVPMPSESPAVEPMSESMMPPMAMPPSRDGCSVKRYVGSERIGVISGWAAPM